MNPIIAWLDSPPPEATARDAEHLARRHYGLEVKARCLYAERDRNFRLQDQHGLRHVLKISNADANPDVVEFQVRALRHIARVAPEIPVPRLVANLGGAFIGHWRGAGGAVHMVRLLGWLEGESAEFRPPSVPGSWAAGRCLARLGRALASCDPAGAPTDLPWDLANTGQYRDLTGFIEDPGMLALVRDRLDRFESELRPALGALRRQVIHNDLNSGNLLFARHQPERVAGIIDFGDMIEGPLIFDLAVAGSYQLSGQEDPLAELYPMVTGYHSVTPLDDAELELLLPLIECRLLATYLIQGTRAAEHPDSRAELAGSSARAAGKLRRLASISRSEGAAFLGSACRMATRAQNP